jgi:hypothetical protein
VAGAKGTQATGGRGLGVASLRATRQRGQGLRSAGCR